MRNSSAIAEVARLIIGRESSWKPMFEGDRVDQAILCPYLSHGRCLLHESGLVLVIVAISGRVDGQLKSNKQ